MSKSTTVIMQCKTHGKTEFARYKDKKNSYHHRCKKCRRDHVQKRRYVLKILAIEYLGGKCSRCGYDKCVGALEFHHLDPKKKQFAISKGGNTRSWDKIKIEIDKCELVCANCHREEHYDPRNLMRELDRR